MANSEQLSDKTLSAVLDITSDAIVVVNRRGEVCHYNAAAETLFGYDRNDILGQPVEVLLPEAMRERHENLRTGYYEAPRQRSLESALWLSARRNDGSIFEAEIALYPLRTQGEDVLVAAAVRDIRGKGTTEPMFRNLLETAPDAMVIIDDTGMIAVANEQAEQMFGYKREQLLGNDIEMLIPERLRKGHLTHRAHYSSDPSVRPMGGGKELLGLRADGSEFPVEISLSPVKLGAHLFVSSVIRDVTERQRMEQEIRAAHEAADRANKANTAFLAAASHDLRQPVQALHLLNGALKRVVKDPRALQMIESQDHSLNGMTNLLNSLLDISRLDAGAIKPEIEDFSIKRMIDRLSAEFSRQASHKGLRFDVEPSNIVVRSDPNLLGEIIQNFVSNAIRYTEKGEVRMACSKQKGRLCVAVSDTGIGIEPEQFEAIFKEFHQCKTPGATQEGFGLGLAIVRRLADLLGHELKVTSTPGKGSCFCVYLPIVDSKKAVATEEATAARVDYAQQSGTIILIEDDFSVADAWGMLLEAEGYNVVTARSALEIDAIFEHLDKKPDLVISDFHLLHGTTGIQAVTAIRDKLEDLIPAFIVTGDTSKVIDEARQLPNAIIMCKPVNIDQLLELAKKAVASGEASED